MKLPHVRVAFALAPVQSVHGAGTLEAYVPAEGRCPP